MKSLVTSFWLVFCISILLFSFGLSWQINKSVNFTYPVWYQVLDIDAHISKYAPQNKYNKQDFVFTDKDQHVKLFEQVVIAINNHGKNLDKIAYHSKNKQQLLFTQSEVIHLQDVSNLVDTLRLVWLVNLLPLILLSLLYMQKKLHMPSTKLKVTALIVSVVVVISSFAIFGFKKIFYYLHTAVFPDNHQWFFYYQESLMSTFMKAPDLFAAMGVNLLVVGIIIFSCCYYFINIQSIKSSILNR
ncbi:DUF1461 domain-containing protein [Thalassotalea psychrophila]|uniref:DUF1461 domain-containing protein n=1 Tax=Thalassotalea psychrophila TaxID=3065647 RepID=A0ABY9TXR6_9GAMM|nr:DUF1461 domain-containing protein [Colwelliaceae bacterium SQ149]